MTREEGKDAMFEELKAALEPKGWMPSPWPNRQLFWRDGVDVTQSAMVMVLETSRILIIRLGPNNLDDSGRRVRNARNVKSAVEMAEALTEEMAVRPVEGTREKKMGNLPPLTYDPAFSPYPSEIAAARGHIFDAIGCRTSFGRTKADAESFRADLNRGLDWVVRATIRAVIRSLKDAAIETYDEMLTMTEEEGELKL